MNVSMPTPITAAASRITDYRDWIASLGRMGLMAMFLCGFFAIMAFGANIEFLQATLGGRGAQVVAWSLLLVVCYTWYSVLRVPFGRVKARFAD